MLARSSSTLARTVSRQAVRRNMSTSQPKMHNADGKWDALKSKRPIDHDDEHVRCSHLKHA